MPSFPSYVMHLELRSAFMFHMLGWAFCLSTGAAVAMHAASDGADLCGGNVPAQDCGGRRVDIPQDTADYTNAGKVYWEQGLVTGWWGRDVWQRLLAGCCGAAPATLGGDDVGLTPQAGDSELHPANTSSVSGNGEPWRPEQAPDSQPVHDFPRCLRARRTVKPLECPAATDELDDYYPGGGVHDEGSLLQGESDDVGLFQTARPGARTWEELMEVFWNWFEADRQVGMAVGMVRRFVEARDDAAYAEWSVSAVQALGAGIPNSGGTEFALTPEDFYVWATEVEATLFRAYTQEQLRHGPTDGGVGATDGPDGEEVAMMERGRRGGERQRRNDRSRSCRRVESRRRRSARASGSSGPVAGAAAATGRAPGPEEALRAAPWRAGTAAGTSVATASSEAGTTARVSGDEFGFVPVAPRDNDDCVDTWRFLLGVDVHALPQGRETTARDQPFFPPERADYVRRVIAGFTATQQGLMTLGLLTALRAMLSELGNILHLASYVEVPVDEAPADAAEPEPEAEESDDTLWMQLELEVVEGGAMTLVQRDVNLITSLLVRFQDAITGGDLGLARLRAEHFRHRLHRLRLGALVDASVADQFEAVCVVAEEAGAGVAAMGYHALEPQVAEWTWHWWRLVEPALVMEPADPLRPEDPIAVSSSLDTARPAVEQGPDVEQLAADQEEARQDAAAEARHQELFEDDEEQYYRGVEALVAHEVEARASREAQAWDDWAMFSEMNQAARGRKRPCLEIAVRPVASGGADGAERCWKIPFVPGKDQLVLGLGYMEHEATYSEASTVPAGGGQRCGEGDAVRAGGGAASLEEFGCTAAQVEDGAIPLGFEEFQGLYDRWRKQQVDDAEVRRMYGLSTLEMLEAQHIVVTEGTQIEASSAPGGSCSHADHRGSSTVHPGEGETGGFDISGHADFLLQNMATESEWVVRRCVSRAAKL